MYDPDHLSSFYDAYGAHEWARLESTAYGRLQAIIHTDFIERYVKPGARVLDAGSGPGRFSVVIARLGGRVTVLDLSEGQLQLAREKLAEAGQMDRVEAFIQADIADLSMLRDDRFDVVVCYGGSLSYVCERRGLAAAELTRVIRPGGTLLVSVMSRFGATANVVRRPEPQVLQDPQGWHVWRVLSEGDLPGFPSRHSDLQHPAMHLFTGEELRDQFSECRVLEVAGSNVSTFEGSTTIEQVAGDQKAWSTAIEIERKLNRVPGLVDSGTHIILAAQRVAP